MSPGRKKTATAPAVTDFTPAPTVPTKFELLNAPLTPGTTLVEASAGTGKTHRITYLVLRLLLEDGENGRARAQELGRVLIVTFTEAATAELVTRVRALLRRALDACEGQVARGDAKDADLWAILDRCGHEKAAERLRDALGEIDELAVLTIHGFCARALEERAFESGAPFASTLLTDDAELLERIALDWWARRVASSPEAARVVTEYGWTPEKAISLLEARASHPSTLLEPAIDLESESIEALVARIAEFAPTVPARWDAEAFAATVAEQKWNESAVLHTPEGLQALAEAVAQATAGDVRALRRLRDVAPSRCGVNRRSPTRLALFADNPFVAACAALEELHAKLVVAVVTTFLVEVFDCFDRVKRERHLLGFDDMLRRLHDRLDEQGASGPLATALRGRFDAVLIDEFQDTDAFQWKIFSTAFTGIPVWIIGDPKQAIYRFRGADIHTYLEAAASVDRPTTIGTNHRSTKDLVDAMNRLFQETPQPFGVEKIRYDEVTAEATLDAFDCGDRQGRALHWWTLRSELEGERQWSTRGAKVRIRRQLVAEVVRLLDHGRVGDRPCLPRDIAILVRTHAEAQCIQQELRAARVPSVVGKSGDVLHTPEAREVIAVLRAVATPRDGAQVRGALATRIWGENAERIHRLLDPSHAAEWHEIVEGLERDRERWLREGVLPTLQSILTRRHAWERLLPCDDGTRRATNLRHLLELAHGYEQEGDRGPDALLARIASESAEGAPDAERRELRLETDADAVQILTIHRSKGLQFPIVFCPDLWTATKGRGNESVRIDGEVRLAAVMRSKELPSRHKNARQLERQLEDVRLAYVALTRARYRCYVAWAEVVKGSRIDRGKSRGLVRVLGDAQPPGERIHSLCDDHRPVMRGEELGLEAPPMPRWRPAETADGHSLAFRRSTRTREDLRPRVTSSFTSLTARKAAMRVVEEQGEREVVEDVRDLDETIDGDAHEERPAATPTGIFAFPAGRDEGHVVHAIFEHLDFADAGTEKSRQLVERTLTRWPAVARRAAKHDPEPAATLDAMVMRVCSVVDPDIGVALREVPLARTLREWEFHLHAPRLGAGGIATALRSADDPALSPAYLDSLAALDRGTVDGFLKGVVDLLFEHRGRYWIADWKSNRLGRINSATDYDRAAMHQAMEEHHYVLQYHIYMLAVHRFLSARVPGYDYDTHIGGVRFLFVRGIEAEPTTGWYMTRPARRTVEALDAWLSGGAA